MIDGGSGYREEVFRPICVDINVFMLRCCVVKCCFVACNFEIDGEGLIVCIVQFCVV